MNKTDFWSLIILNLVALILLVEHWCGLELALPILIIWSIISLIVHIWILKDYIFTVTVEEE